MSTVEVVPSPVTSSCATAVLAIMTAVGFWICISRSSTFPSFVSLMPPAPSTSILIVPLGPRLVFMTSCSPLAALMFIKRAACDPMTSAFGLRFLTPDIVGGCVEVYKFLGGLIARPELNSRGLSHNMKVVGKWLESETNESRMFAPRGKGGILVLYQTCREGTAEMPLHRQKLTY